MAKGKILIIEDDEDILELVRYTVAKEGYEVTGVLSGEEGLAVARSTLPDLIILDLMLPEVSGFQVCAQLKADERTQHIAIVMLTAKTDEADIVAGLELGADDYIAKPFSPRVIVARIGSVLRRRAREPVNQNSVLKVHDLMINPGKHEVTVKSKRIQLTATEFRILHFLASRPGWVFPRTRIADAVHGEGLPATSRSVDVQISALRRKLGPAGKLIETIRGAGYRFRE